MLLTPGGLGSHGVDSEVQALNACRGTDICMYPNVCAMHFYRSLCMHFRCLIYTSACKTLKNVFVHALQKELVRGGATVQMTSDRQ